MPDLSTSYKLSYNSYQDTARDDKHVISRNLDTRNYILLLSQKNYSHNSYSINQEQNVSIIASKRKNTKSKENKKKR